MLDKARLVFSRGLSMANFMDLAADIHGERLALVLDDPLHYRVHMGDTVTYRQSSNLTSRMAHAMVRLGVRRGDRVVVVTSNRVDLPFLVSAIMKMGGVAVPLNFMLRGREIAYVAENCGARVLVTDAEVFRRNIRAKEAIPGIETWVMAGPAEEALEGFLSLDELMEGTPQEFEPVLVKGDDLVGIFYTSGTTGFPKGAMMTSRGLITGQKLAALAMPLGPGDMGIHCLPLAHLFGYGICIMGQLCGMSAYFMSYFNPVKVLQVIEEHRATVFVGVPVMYKSFFEVGFENYDLSSMRFWASSTDAMPQEYIDRVRRQGSAWRLGPLKTGPVFAEAYGMVELSAIATLKLNLPGLRWPPGCVGFPIFPIRARVVDESGGKLPAGKVGELLVTGPGVMKGYWNDPEETARVMDGKWMHTGDMARKDRWGRIYYVDRKKDVIKCGGFSVFSMEVEQEILNHPAVLQAVVVGVPNPTKGEAPVAVVCLRQDLAPGEEVTEDELLRWCWVNIARYKCPRRVHIVSPGQIPYGVTLKVLKRDLRRRYIKDLTRQDVPSLG